jgi:hypothetical protein
MNVLPNPEDFRWIFPSGGANSLEQEGEYFQKWEKGVFQSNSAWE